MTFGYGRIEIVAALINHTTLIVIGLYLIYEGGMRLIVSQQVEGWTRLETIKTEIKAKLEAEFAIAHSTLEFEHPGHAHANAARYDHGSAMGRKQGTFEQKN